MSGYGISNPPINHEQIHSSGAQVENQYQRKADLIPNLMATAKGFSVPCKDWQKKFPLRECSKWGFQRQLPNKKKYSKRTKKAYGGN
jgi:hypothetical protein|tara:strand:- start:284 stop:544 length:261 start_codon:yes stop_codon:yes gene_type:complete